mmetsp:Transcript_36085/g.58327  ORF Transcript_36085/g.58327 Transcript_36085/m.58327 type:complete len:135 (-) Transcript_36085:278-682(-)
MQRRVSGERLYGAAVVVMVGVGVVAPFVSLDGMWLKRDEEEADDSEELEGWEDQEADPADTEADSEVDPEVDEEMEPEVDPEADAEAEADEEADPIDTTAAPADVEADPEVDADPGHSPMWKGTRSAIRHCSLQ